MHKIPVEALEKVCAGIEGTYGLHIYVNETGEEYCVGGENMLHAASTIKVPILALLLRDARDGKIDLNSKIGIAQGNRASGSGILKMMDPSTELTIYDMMLLMITYSDNTATNVCIDAAGGTERVTEFCREMGLPNTVLDHKLSLTREYPVPPNRSCAADMGKIMKLISRGEFVDAEVSRGILRFMTCQKLLTKFASGVPYEEWSDPRRDAPLPKEGYISLASKGGTLTGKGISHDVAVVTLPDGRRYTMVLYSKTESTAAMNKVFAEIARLMYEAMK